MRIRRQPQLNPQGTRAENPSDGCLPSPAIVESKPLSPPQNVAEDLHANIEGLSMIYSTSKFKASVNWLDRLRAAKGFPVDSHSHIEEFLSLRACCPEDKQCCRHEQDDVACLKHGSVTVLEGGRNGVSGLRDRVAETVLCESLNSNIMNTALPPQAASCNNRSMPAESHPSRSHSRSLGKQQSLASAENSIAGPNSSLSPNLNKGAHSKSPDIPSSLSQDSNAEAALSQLYFNMFADLFCMDSCSLNSGGPLPLADVKKRQRKQGKPKVCSTFADPDPPSAVVTSSQLQTCEFDTQASCPNDSGNPTSQSEVAAVVKTDIPSPSPEVEGSEKTLAQQKKTPNKVSDDTDKKRDNMELEQGPMNELFVIDTSLPGWKARKFIIRKGSGWRIKDKEFTAPVKGTSSECTPKELKKRPATPPTSNTKNESTNEPKQCAKNESTNASKQWALTTCKEKIHQDAANSGECPSNTEHVARLWSTAPHTHIRSSRKRRKTTLPEEEAPKETPEPTCTNVDFSEKSPELTPEDPANTQIFAMDHPANQPKEGLVYSIYIVFMQAGKSGLTPREAVSRILEQGLPGLHEGGVVPRVEVLKIVSNSPYFMPLEESKYILCSALVGEEDFTAGGKQSTQDSKQNDNENGYDSFDNVKSAKQHGMSQYWAACAAIRRARTGTTRRKPSLGSYFLNSTSHETLKEIGILSSKKRLKSVKQDVTGLGNPCNRSDGKGWHCPLRAKVGYLLCDHHLDRLRTRVKSHIKSKMLSITKASKDERKRILGGSWMVKKVVERSRIGRPSHVSFGADLQDEFPVDASEVSGSRLA